MSGSTIKAEATLLRRVALFFLSPLFPWGAALCAMLLVAGTLDVDDSWAYSTVGPGLTLDEGFNVETGVYLAYHLGEHGIAIFHPELSREINSHPAYNPDHPPLGRWLMGIAAVHLRSARNGQLPLYSINGARLASACEYGLLVLLIAFYSRRWFGPLTAATATVSFMCLPRVFAHAHLASLETCTNLTYTAFVFVLADRWWKLDRVPLSRSIRPGIALGLALLTKIHAVLLLPVILVWGLWNWGWKSLPRLVLIGLIGLVVFFAGWPWLWIDPIAHFQEYFARATQRDSLNCYYLGVKYADTDVPWHYPFVMFAVTMPVGFLIAGFVGLLNRTGDENSRYALFDRRSQLVFGAWLLPLMVFALPGVTVYDGVRLFLMCFPLFSIFVGLGAARLLETIQRRRGNFAATMLVLAALAGPLYNMVTLHPCQLSYYNELVFGLGQADEFGFETTYWGDCVTPGFLETALSQIPENSTLQVAPVLHPLQLEFMKRGSWLQHRPDLKLRANDDTRDDLSPYVLVIRRKADPWTSLSPPPQGTQRLAVVERQGVVLTELLQLPEHTPR